MNKKQAAYFRAACLDLAQGPRRSVASGRDVPPARKTDANRTESPPKTPLEKTPWPATPPISSFSSSYDGGAPYDDATRCDDGVSHDDACSASFRRSEPQPPEMILWPGLALGPARRARRRTARQSRGKQYASCPSPFRFLRVLSGTAPTYQCHCHATARKEELWRPRASFTPSSRPGMRKVCTPYTVCAGLMTQRRESRVGSTHWRDSRADLRLR